MSIKKLLFILVMLPTMASADEIKLGDYFTVYPNGYRILLAEDGTPTSEVRLIGCQEDMKFVNCYYGDANVPDEVEYGGKTYQVVEFGPFYRSQYPPELLIFGKNMRKINFFRLFFPLPNGFEVAEENQHYKTIDNILYSKDGKTLVMCPFGFEPRSSSTITIPDNVETIGELALAYCKNINFPELPKSLKVIEEEAFFNFKNMPTEIVLPEGIKAIGPQAFSSTSIQKLTLPSTLETIGYLGGLSELESLVCLAPTPPATDMTNSIGLESHWYNWDDYYQNAVLMVPVGSKELYQQDPAWGMFKHIMEIGEVIEKKCASPTIRYEKGELKFSSATEGAEFVTDITAADAKRHYDSSISLEGIYTIKVYAHKEGYDNSETVTVTLCWLDANPSIETNIVNELHARPLLIQAREGVVSATGLEEGETVQVFSIEGLQLASAKAIGSTLTIPVTSPSGQTLIVKIADKAVKVIMSNT